MSKQLTLSKDQDLIIDSFVLKNNGLVVEGEPTFEEWLNLGEFIKKAEKSVHFWIGDWLNYGEFTWGEKYAQAMDATGYDYGTLRNDKWVAGKIDLSRRRDSLSFEHHKEVAELEPEEQLKLLEFAEANNFGRNDFREAVKKYKVEQGYVPEPKICQCCGRPL